MLLSMLPQLKLALIIEVEEQQTSDIVTLAKVGLQESY